MTDQFDVVETLTPQDFVAFRNKLTPASGLQSHQHRSEYWTVVSGSAQVVLDEETLQLKVNDSITIPKNTKHRLENSSSDPLIIIEIQFGHLLDENDISRFEDRYGRC